MIQHSFNLDNSVLLIMFDRPVFYTKEIFTEADLEKDWCTATIYEQHLRYLTAVKYDDGGRYSVGLGEYFYVFSTRMRALRFIATLKNMASNKPLCDYIL